jgi:uncharacterized protein DUF2877
MTAASVALWTLLAGPSRPARVLEIHAGTVYLHVDPLPAADSRDGRDHPGAVLALLRPDAVRLPIGLVLPSAAAELMPVSVAGAPVSRGEITIGWGAITLDKARWPILDWWNPGVPALPIPARSITSAALKPQADQFAAELIPAADSDPVADQSSRPTAGLSADPSADPAFASTEQQGSHSITDSPPDPVRSLTAGLAALAAGDAEAAVRQLIALPGADQGPVAAGNDVLGGALAALAAWAPDAPSRQILATAVAEAADRTTMISAALLQSAAAGFAVPELVRYLTALSTDGSDVDPAFAALTAIGAGSGTAMGLGVRAQLRALHAGHARTPA